MPYGIGDGRKVVAAAGTAESLEAATHQVALVIITAETDNADVVAVGGSGVVESDSTRTGVSLNAGDSVTLYNVDLYEIYLDAGTNGEGVTYLWVA